MAKAEIVTLPLALQDTMPVALSAAGMVIVAKEASTQHDDRRPWLLAGAALIAAGGTAKVGWKLLVVAGWDVGWLQDLLFPLLAPGLALLAAGVIAARRGRPSWRGPQAVLAVVGAIAATTALASWGTALVVARVLAIVAATTLSVVLARTAWGSGDRLAASLFALNLAITVLMGRLAAVEDQTTALQWVEQLVNTVSQGAFLWAAVRLRAGGALRNRDTTAPRRTMTVG